MTPVDLEGKLTVPPLMEIVQGSGLSHGLNIPNTPEEWVVMMQENMGGTRIQIFQQIFGRWSEAQQLSDFPPEFWEWVGRVEHFQEMMSGQLKQMLEVLKNHEGSLRGDLPQIFGAVDRQFRSQEQRLQEMSVVFQNVAVRERAHVANMDRASAEINDLRGQLNGTREEIHGLRSLVELLRGEVERIKLSGTEGMRNVANLAQQVDQRGGDTQVLRAEMADLRGQIARLGTPNLPYFEEELNMVTGQARQATQGVDDLKIQLKTVKESLQSRQDALSHILKEIRERDHNLGAPERVGQQIRGGEREPNPEWVLSIQQMLERRLDAFKGQMGQSLAEINARNLQWQNSMEGQMKEWERGWEENTPILENLGDQPPVTPLPPVVPITPVQDQPGRDA